MQSEKSTSKRQRLKNEYEKRQRREFLICALLEIVIIFVFLTIGLAAYEELKKQEEQQMIDELIKQAELEDLQKAEHEVVEVKEAIPDVYMPVDMFEKDMFNGQYSREEVCLVAALAYCEMGGESVKGIQYAVSVVLNRVELDYYPNTIEEVVYQAGQYEPALKGTINKFIDIYYYNNTDGLTEEQLEDYERNFEAVLYVFENGSLLPLWVDCQAPFAQGTIYEVVDGEIFSGSRGVF